MEIKLINNDTVRIKIKRKQILVGKKKEYVAEDFASKITTSRFPLLLKVEFRPRGINLFFKTDCLDFARNYLTAIFQLIELEEEK